MGESSQTGWGKKGLISTFACFLTAIAKVQFVERRLGTRLYLHSNLRFSKILSLKPFGNSRGNLYTKFAISTRCCLSLYLWLIVSALKHSKVSKFYDQDCSYQPIFTLPNMFKTFLYFVVHHLTIFDALIPKLTIGNLCNPFYDAIIIPFSSFC